MAYLQGQREYQIYWPGSTSICGPWVEVVRADDARKAVDISIGANTRWRLTIIKVTAKASGEQVPEDLWR